ncbi:MAG: S41 family peptidase [Nitrospirota bacterium]
MKKFLQKKSYFIFIVLSFLVLLPQAVVAGRTPDVFEKAFSVVMKNHVEAPNPSSLSASAIREMIELLRSKKIDHKMPDGDGSAAPRNSDEAVRQVVAFYKEIAGSTDISPEELEGAAIKGLLKALDPHSQHMSVRQVKDMSTDITGKFTGVGLQIGIKNEQLVVVAPIEDSPAFRAGIQAGDAIMKIDNVPTKGMSITDAVDKLRGKKGTRVNITIARASFKDPYDVTIERDTITVRSVKSRMLDDGIGYIKISQFQGQTANDVEAALRDLESNGMRKLILDLRSNPGGLLDASVGVSGKFLVKGSLVVTLQGRERADRKEFKTSGSYIAPDRPMIVLVDNGSASASEILSGALKDHQRAVIVGAKTFGKGSVQTVFPLNDGSALRLTTALYYTPAHTNVEKAGITPDVEVVEKENDDASLKVAQAALRSYSEPNVSHAKLAQIALRFANDKREEFEQAKAANTFDAYDKFLKAFPSSANRKPALQAMAVLIEKQNRGYEEYKKFVAAYEDGLEFVPGKYRLGLTGPEGLRVGDIAGFRKKGVGDNIIAAKIRSGKGRYRDYSFDEIDQLKKMGIPEVVIEAMIESTSRVTRDEEESQKKKNMEELLAEIQRMQKKLDEMRTAQASGAAVPVSAGQSQGPSVVDTVQNCAAQITALEACKHLPRLGAMICRAAAKSQFPCE